MEDIWKHLYGLFDTLAWSSDIINLQNHTNKLGGQVDLLFLADQGLNYALILHIYKIKVKINI